MTLRELMDTCENDLSISESTNYSNPFVAIKDLAYNTAGDYEDVFTQEFLDRKVCCMRATSETVLVYLREGNSEH